MFSDFDECECTVDYTDEEIKGLPTKMEYKGNGVYVCPSCNHKVDYSEYTFKITVKIEIIGRYKELKIIDGEERINHHWYDNKRYLIIKDCIEEDLNQGELEDWFKEHELGIFDIEIYYEPTKSETQDGIDYDLNIFIIKETLR